MEFLEDIWFWFLDFVDDYNRELKVGGIACAVAIILAIAIYIIVDPVKIVWAGEDSEIIATNSSSLSHGAIAYNRKSTAYSVEYEVSAGTVEVQEDGNVIWNLPIEEGTYTITAKHDKKKISKSVTVLGNALINDLALKVEEVFIKDTDGDGLPDNYETTVSLTDPNNKDTDGDGIFDGNELLLSLNPLEPDTQNDGITDDQKTLEYVISDKEASVTVTLKGKQNLPTTTIDKYSTETLGNVTSVVSDLYAIYSEAKLDSANIAIVYNPDVLKNKGIDANNLAIYELNEEKNSFERLETTLNIDNHTVNTIVTSFGKYFVADRTTLKPSLSTELMFVIDNSGSMYSKNEISDSEENDVNFKRVDLPKKLVDKLKGNYKFGAGKFTFEYTNLVDMTDNKEEVKNKINTIKTSVENFSGTYIGNAIDNGLKQFEDDDTINRKYMLLLTDGKDTSGVTGYNGKLLEEAIKKATTKKVKIYTIGLGDYIDKEVLQKIAKNTGGKFYFASTADDLNNIFELISAELNYNLIDIDNDNVDDHILLYDSGFTAKRDGLSFANFANSTNVYGGTYGMALLSKLYYENALAGNYKSITLKVGDTVIEAQEANTSNALGNMERSLYRYMPENITFLGNIPKDFWSNQVQSGTLKIKPDYQDTLKLMGFTVYNQDYTTDKASFKGYENYMLDVSVINNKEINYDEMKITREEVELIKLIYRLDVYKYRDEEFRFIDDNDKAYAKLAEILKSGKPALLKLNDKYTVLALKLVADKDDINHMKIEVYDPNYNGQIKYIDMERTKNIAPKDYNEITSKYEYRFKYQGIKCNVSISIPNLASNL